MESSSDSHRTEKDETEEKTTSVNTKLTTNLIPYFFKILIDAQRSEDEQNARLLSVVQNDFLKYLKSIHLGTNEQTTLLTRLNHLITDGIIANTYFVRMIINDIAKNGEMLKDNLQRLEKENSETLEQLLERLRTMQSDAKELNSNANMMTVVDLYQKGLANFKRGYFTHALTFFSDAASELIRLSSKNPDDDLLNTSIAKQVSDHVDESLYQLAYQSLNNSADSEVHALENAIYYLDQIPQKSDAAYESSIKWRILLAELYLKENKIDAWLDQVSAIFATFDELAARYVDMALNTAGVQQRLNQSNEQPLELSVNTTPLEKLKTLYPNILIFSHSVLNTLFKLAEGHVVTSNDSTKSRSDSERGIYYCDRALEYIFYPEKVSGACNQIYSDEDRIGFEQLQVKLYSQFLEYLLTIAEKTNNNTEVSVILDKLTNVLHKLQEATQQLNATLAKNFMDLNTDQLEQNKIFEEKITSITKQESNLPEAKPPKRKYSLGPGATNEMRKMRKIKISKMILHQNIAVRNETTF